MAGGWLVARSGHQQQRRLRYLSSCSTSQGACYIHLELSGPWSRHRREDSQLEERIVSRVLAYFPPCPDTKAKQPLYQATVRNIIN